MKQPKHAAPPGRYRTAAVAAGGLLVLVIASGFLVDACSGGARTRADGPAGGDASGSVPPTVATGSPITTPATAPPTSDGPRTTKAATVPTYFTTVRPGGTLPTGAQCAAWVRARPIAENKRVNAAYNRTTGQKVPADLFGGSAQRAAKTIAPRIDGNFTGTTHEIIRWAACKWGFDEDRMKAQVAIESWWREDTLGDFHDDATRCPPGHGLGVDGKAGLCPESYGLMQTRYPYMPSTWPGIGRSSAMNVDVGFAILRSCFEGYETWLNTVERGKDYAAGDLTGCMGRWFSGRWYDQGAKDYIARVNDYYHQRIWRTANFQEG